MIDNKRIEEEIEKASSLEDEHWGMSYEDGIIDALKWVIKNDPNVSIFGNEE